MHWFSDARGRERNRRYSSGLPETGGDSATALHAVDLRKRYGRFEALRGVSLDIPRGAIHGLLGPNGAGKSTLIKLLVGAARPSAGEARVLGMDPVANARPLRPRIGYMPQSPALYEDLSAQENVRFFARAHALDDRDAAIEEAIEFVALGARRDDPVYAFSGGMKQRVSLACALVHRPEVLFLDEPTAGVDPELKHSFWQHFRELAARRVTLIISSHLMDEALLCDRLTILHRGRVLITAPPAEIMQRGRTEVAVWYRGREERAAVERYYTGLPRLLQRYGLDRDVSRIELHEDTLDSIMMAMVREDSS